MTKYSEKNLIADGNKFLNECFTTKEKSSELIWNYIKKYNK